MIGKAMIAGWTLLLATSGQSAGQKLRVHLSGTCSSNEVHFSVTATNMTHESVYILTGVVGPDGKPGLQGRGATCVVLGKLQPPDPKVRRYVDRSGGYLVELGPDQSHSWEVQFPSSSLRDVQKVSYKMGYFHPSAFVKELMAGRRSTFVYALAAPAGPESEVKNMPHKIKDNVMALPPGTRFLYQLQHSAVSNVFVLGSSCAQ